MSIWINPALIFLHSTRFDYRLGIGNLHIHLLSKWGDSPLSMISRITGPAQGRSLVSSYAGLVYAVSYDPHAATGITAQTRNALEFLDQNLSKAGSSKCGLLQATVYLSDMSMKARMDEVWCEWIGPRENWPQRACVGADLGDEVTLIEIVVTAVML